MRYGERGVNSEIQTVEKELQEKTWSKPAVMVGQEKAAQVYKKTGKTDCGKSGSKR